MANREYSVRQLMLMDACTNCQVCADVCPAVMASSDGYLSGVHRLGELRKIVRSRGGLLKRLFGRKEPSQEQLAAFSETVFRCTLCGQCQEVCPVGIDLKEIWVALRQDLNANSAYPAKVDTIRDNLIGSHNVFDEDNEDRSEWVEDLDDEPEDGLVRDEAEIVYFTGCVAAFFPMAQQIPVALAEILTVGEVDFTLLGEEEWCCGFPLLGAGLKSSATEIIEHNVEAIKEKKAKKVVFACPSCYQMWREHYPKEFELYHATQFLDDLIKQGRVPMKELSLTVTYHDPCDLGRGAREFEAPRNILRSIPGVQFRELPRNREMCQCCGGGGNLEMIDAELSGNIAKAKIEEVMSIGVQAVVSSCQQCVRTMATYARRNKIPLEVLDITQLMRRALKA